MAARTTNGGLINSEWRKHPARKGNVRHPAEQKRPRVLPGPNWLGMVIDISCLPAIDYPARDDTSLRGTGIAFDISRHYDRSLATPSIEFDDDRAPVRVAGTEFPRKKAAENDHRA